MKHLEQVSKRYSIDEHASTNKTFFGVFTLFYLLSLLFIFFQNANK